MFEDYFNFVAPTVLTETLCEIKNKKENDKLVNVIKSGLIDLKDEIEKMSEDEKNLKNQIKYQNLLKKFLSSSNKNNCDKA